MTGAVRRGDVATIKAHLAALAKAGRELYVLLTRRAVALARTLPLLLLPRLAEMERLLAGR